MQQTVNPINPIIIKIIAIPEPLPLPTIIESNCLKIEFEAIIGSKHLSANIPPNIYPIGIVAY